MSDEPILSARRLTKQFKQLRALNDFSLDVDPGVVIGLLGPNGSGKSTLVRLLMGFLIPTSGTATVLGLDCTRNRTEVHHKVAYLPGDARLFRTMRGKDVLSFFASIRGSNFLPRSRELADRFDLDLSRWVAFMSTGMRQKLALSVVMAIDSPLMILDEPTANLDPSVRKEVLTLVKEAQAEGRTVIFSSHVLDEIENVCNRVIILRGGELVHQQAIDDVTNEFQIRIISNESLPPVPAALAEKAVLESTPSEDGHSLDLKVQGDLNGVLEWTSSLPLESVRMHPVDLRSVYDRFHEPGGVN